MTFFLEDIFIAPFSFVFNEKYLIYEISFISIDIQYTFIKIT